MKTNKNDGEGEVQGCGKFGWWMREGYANAPGSSKYQEIKKSPIERESAYVLHVSGI